MNKEFKYMPLETDATGGRGGDMPAISKHMSKSPLGLYKDSPAKLVKGPNSISKRKEQNEKGGRVEKGLPVNPGAYDMTTAQGKTSYMSDRKESRTNRLKIKNDLRNKKNSGQITNKEYNSTMSDRGKKAQEKPGTYGSDIGTYTVGKGWNQDIKKARSRTGANSKTTRNT
jgi:hypothetical protein